MPDVDPRLARLAQAHGISTEFWDWKGQHKDAAPETILACLRALGVATDGSDWIDKAYVELDERPWRYPLPPCVVAERNQERYVAVHVPAGRPANVWARLEDGSTFFLEQVDNEEPDRWLDDHWVGRATFRLPTTVATGYHTLFLESDERYWETDFILTPETVGLPGLGQRSVWGIMAQLYSIAGETSWGIGDFTDLADLAVWAKTQLHADFVLTNPVHAAEVAPPMTPSPYFPATRRYVNPLYIRPEAIEEYAIAPEPVRTVVETCRARARASAGESAQIPRDAVWAQKKEALLALFAVGRRPSRQMEFDEYAAQHGEDLERFATWCVLTEQYGAFWRKWPRPYHNPGSREVEAFARTNRQRISFYMWLQWVADEQARGAQTGALDVGMRVGVMSDLAVGVNRDGEETWGMQDVFARGVTVGAPPDAYNQAGQDWLQPPWRPDRLEETAYAPLRAMIAALLRHSGAVRVDHIMGLFRLWWIPEGKSAADGAYIRYDHEAMVGILALEAERARTAIIGEDLGTVEPWVREYLAARGILGTSVAWFEMDQEGRPLNPEQWRALCLGSVTTHDLPPTLGYLAHDHIALRYRLGLLTESLEDEIKRDAADQDAILKMLVGRGLISSQTADPHEVLKALHRFLYQTPARLKCVALTDMVGERRTQNQPGTIDEYPNWRVPLADEAGERLTLEKIYSLTSPYEIADIMNGRV
ncbi:MAG: 4-alpha-glucanotransferase [Propionibacteriaceae bacterium]|jgi:4-alpha-glucanotransferase|nr:4-alpha-glucanotransferase [Propionibacteriaceae bacterium]